MFSGRGCELSLTLLGLLGFLVSLIRRLGRGRWRGAAIDDWFGRHFRGHAYQSDTDWTPERVQELAELVAATSCWKRDPGGDRPHEITLDINRMSECVEAWIPVSTEYGPGVLLRDNSD